MLRLLQHTSLGLSHALPYVTTDTGKCCRLFVQNLGALQGQRRLSYEFSHRARPCAGAAAPEVTAASSAWRGMATAPAPAPAEGPALPHFEHTPVPYDGPPKDEVLALRKRFLNPCAPAFHRPLTQAVTLVIFQRQAVCPPKAASVCFIWFPACHARW